jgi:hypothetical protein
MTFFERDAISFVARCARRRDAVAFDRWADIADLCGTDRDAALLALDVGIGDTHSDRSIYSVPFRTSI